MPKSDTGRGKNQKLTTEPRLAIFWLVDGTLLIDSAPLSECDKYGDNLNFPGSHIAVWEQWRQAGKASAESEYEEYPRGRVMCDIKTKKFTLLADRCILKRKDLTATIKDELHLPKKTTLGTDPHYRCFTCLHGAENED